MKKFLLIICLCAPLFAQTASARKSGTREKITSFVSEFRKVEGAHTVHLGWLGTGLVKGAIRVAAIDDPDARESLKLLKDIKGLTVFSYEDCSDDGKNRIVRRIDKLLSGSELILEANEEGNSFRIYGLYDEKSGKVSDLVLFAAEECALIFVAGSVSLDEIAAMASND